MSEAVADGKSRRQSRKSDPHERLCVGCRRLQPKQNLLRVVRQTTGKCAVDFSGKMNGRGAYLCFNENCLKLAKKNKSLVKSLRCPIDDEFYRGLLEIISARTTVEDK